MGRSLCLTQRQWDWERRQAVGMAFPGRGRKVQYLVFPGGLDVDHPQWYLRKYCPEGPARDHSL